MKNMHYYKVIGMMLSLLFLPSFTYVMMQTSSMAIGLFFSLIIIVILCNKSKLPIINNKFFIYSSLLIHYFIMCFVDERSISEKHISSILFIILMVLSASFFSLDIKKLSNEKFIYFIKKLSILIVFIGFLSQLVTVNFSYYAVYSKSIFPFSEPSHYILTTGAILLSSGFFMNKKSRKILVLSLLSLSITLQSTAALLLFVILFIIYYMSNIKSSIIILLLVFVGFYNINLEYFNYFYSRLNVSQDNHNLTKLVYFQGWDFAYRGLTETNGVGLGFQNLNLLQPGNISNLIYSLSGKYKNNSDGGFLAAKIIAEFGILGLLLTSHYLFTFCKSFLILINIVKNKLTQFTPGWLVLSHSIVVTFFIEMFVRGYGYFSPSVFLMLLSQFILGKRSVLQRK